MDEETYLKALEENPLLPRRPDLITDASQNTRDFCFDETGMSKKIINHKIRTETGEFVGVPRSLEQARHESIYFDAYAGDDLLDEEAERNN